MDGSLKFCRDCKTFVATSDFTPSKRAKDGLQSYCKPCYARRAAERRRRDPVHAKELANRFRTNHREAINARNRAKYHSDPEKAKAYRKASYAKYRDRELAAMRKWKAENRERMRQRQAARYWSDPDAARKKQMDYLNSRPGLSRARRMNRIAAQVKATPAWADHSRIASIYAKAAVLTRETSIPHEVDHIIPIRSPIVCGLHCESNLQILTRKENRRKANRLLACAIA